MKNTKPEKKKSTDTLHKTWVRVLLIVLAFLMVASLATLTAIYVIDNIKAAKAEKEKEEQATKHTITSRKTRSTTDPKKKSTDRRRCFLFWEAEAARKRRNVRQAVEKGCRSALLTIFYNRAHARDNGLF